MQKKRQWRCGVAAVISAFQGFSCAFGLEASESISERKTKIVACTACSCDWDKLYQKLPWGWFWAFNVCCVEMCQSPSCSLKPVHFENHKQNIARQLHQELSHTGHHQVYPQPRDGQPCPSWARGRGWSETPSWAQEARAAARRFRSGGWWVNAQFLNQPDCLGLFFYYYYYPSTCILN